MADSRMNPKVDAFINKSGKWREEYAALRDIVLDCQLTEELKWGVPCYTFQQRNIVIIHGFKDYFALLFFKGALMRDPNGLLIQQTENVQAGRQVRFVNIQEIRTLEPILKAYIHEAIGVEKSGAKIPRKQTKDFAVPEEFQVKLREVPALKKAFAALTPGRQRAYLLHFSGAKQSTTRSARIEKCMPNILAGKGLDD